MFFACFHVETENYERGWKSCICADFNVFLIMALLFSRSHNFFLKSCITNCSLLAKNTGISTIRRLTQAPTKTISNDLCRNSVLSTVFKKRLLLAPKYIFQNESSVIWGLKIYRLFSTGNEYKSPKRNTKKEFKSLFDLDTNVQQDVLLFSCHKADAFYTFFSWFGLIFFCMAIAVGEMAWTLFGALPSETEEEKQQAWYNRFSLRNKVLRYIFMLLIVLVGMMGVALGFMVPMRAVREIHLMAGGKMGRIITFGPFGKHMTIEQPLTNIVPIHSRTEHKSNMMVKVLGYRGFFSCDVGKGIFHEKQLYDFTVGSKSSL
ncbi:transmembrane protein 223-like [Argopecten irradians]|uniref:transmembrane protein 223-like n=1 Tax=Argopecten irradians TaxID=31199 RepID=UPI00371D2A68